MVLTAALATFGTSVAALAQEPAEGTLKLPVSLDKIREGLAQPAPAEALKGLNDPPPTFKIEIQEQQKFDELVS